MRRKFQVIEGETRRLAEFASSLTYEEVPKDVIAMAKHLILDTLGTALAATKLGAGCRELTDVLSRLGGNPESTILGGRHKVSALHAAMANGGLAHALNYDALGAEIGHIGVICLPAPLAIAESIGNISGRDFLVAVTVASEITARTSAAQSRTGKTPSEKFMAGQLFGYIGAAAGAGSLLRLNASQMRSAFGIALMQASGTMQVVLGGDPPAKAIYGAFPNHGGVLAALLSQGGLNGECDAIEGAAGLYAMFYQGEYEKSVLTENLGDDYLLMQTQFKPWPTSATAHAFIEAAGNIAKRGGDWTSIKSVEIIGSLDVRPWCEPIEDRRLPKNAAAAANSIPFCVAKALVHGGVTLSDFAPDGITDNRAASVARRVSYLPRSEVRGGIVRVTTSDGRTSEEHVAVPLGHLSRPMPFDRIVSKFRDCSRFSLVPMGSDRIEKLIELIDNLEERDPSEIPRLACGEAYRETLL